MPSALDLSPLLALLRWVSPTLPVGAYAYSRGLEHAVHAGWVHDEASALSWIAGLLRHGLCALDAPIVQRIHQVFSADNHGSVREWNDYLAASRESGELALEDAQMGSALVRVLRSTQVLHERDELPEAPGYATAFAIACARSGVGARETVLGFLWTTAESQTSAAVRLIPLGQTAGQRMLSAFSKELPELVELSLARRDHELGASLPALALGSALHETQYTRLFRS